MRGFGRHDGGGEQFSGRIMRFWYSNSCGDDKVLELRGCKENRMIDEGLVKAEARKLSLLKGKEGDWCKNESGSPGRYFLFGKLNICMAYGLLVGLHIAGLFRP